MRCCLHNMSSAFKDDDNVENGDTTPCSCSNSGMTLVKGKWLANWRANKELHNDD